MLKRRGARILLFCVTTFALWLIATLVVWSRTFDVARATWNAMSLIVLPVLWVLFALLDGKLFRSPRAVGREGRVFIAAVVTAAALYWPTMAAVYLILAMF